VEKLREAREVIRMAKSTDPGAALDALFGDEQRRLIAEAAEVFGQTEESLMQSLATEIKNAAGFATANSDRRLAIVASRLTQLVEEVGRRRQKSGSTGGGAGQPPAAGGTSKGGEARTGDTKMSSRGQGGLAAKLEPIKARLRDAVTAVTQVNR
jgi:hypothetical protein